MLNRGVADNNVQILDAMAFKYWTDDIEWLNVLCLQSVDYLLWHCVCVLYTWKHNRVYYIKNEELIIIIFISTTYVCSAGDEFG